MPDNGQPRKLTKSEKRRQLRDTRDRQYREWQATQPVPERAPRRSGSRSQCGPVTVTRSDGTVAVTAALTAAQVRKLAPERLVISPALRARVLRRDRQTCRYCRTTVGPFEIDHVIPVAHGGATAFWNLVTACCECNGRKGASVWRPVPLSAVRAGHRQVLTYDIDAG